MYLRKTGLLFVERIGHLCFLGERSFLGYNRDLEKKNGSQDILF